jgi:osmoprotectant transport system ATP-binding protein
MLELRGVSKRYGPRAALRDIDLLIGAGERVALIGPSGCGKSTALRLLVGLITPDGGAVRVLDQPMTRATAPSLRHRIGYVIQDGGLFPHLIARDNASLLARHLGWSASRIAARIDQLAQLVRLPTDLLSRYPLQLSGGQRQRVSLMRALMLDPDVLLLDEPFAALDPMVRAELQDDLRDVFASLGKTVVVVTHDLAEAAYLADELVLLRDGAIVQRGPLSAFLDAPGDAFVTAFVRAQRSLAIGAA